MGFGNFEVISNSMIIWCMVGIWAIVVPTAKMPPLKTILGKEILRNKNHIYEIEPVQMLCLKQEKIIIIVRYWIFKNLKNSKFFLTSSLPDHICKPRHQTKHHTATILEHNHRITSEMCLLWFRQVWGPCASLFLLSSINLFLFFFV